MTVETFKNKEQALEYIGKYVIVTDEASSHFNQTAKLVHHDSFVEAYATKCDITPCDSFLLVSGDGDIGKLQNWQNSFHTTNWPRPPKNHNLIHCALCRSQ